MAGGRDFSPRTEQPHAPIVERRQFMGLADLEFQKALRLRYPVSLVTILVESPDRDDVRRIGKAIQPLIRRTDAIGLVPGLSALHLLLVDALLPEAALVIGRVRAIPIPSTCRLRFGAACLPSTAHTLSELIAKAIQEAVQSGSGP
jgi:hypothetical protein